MALFLLYSTKTFIHRLLPLSSVVAQLACKKCSMADLQEHSLEELNSWQLVRVSEDFHVVALGVPVPKFRGHSLDPPLRSRFQAKHVPPTSFLVRCSRRSILNVIDTEQYEWL